MPKRKNNGRVTKEYRELLHMGYDLVEKLSGLDYNKHRVLVNGKNIKGSANGGMLVQKALEMVKCKKKLRKQMEAIVTLDDLNKQLKVWGRM